MAVQAETLRVRSESRRSLTGQVDGVTRSTTAAWAGAWDELSEEWAGAMEELASSGVGGKWPSPAKVRRAERAQRALDATRSSLEALSEDAAARVNGQLPALSRNAAKYQAQMVGSQMPEEAGTAATSGVAFDKVDPGQLEAAVGRSSQQITALHYPISGEATAAIQAELIRGVAVGDNPRRAAARMVDRVEGRFNGGLGRALNIARTEMLDVHRNAAGAQDQANADVLKGWQWLATLDRRTCPSCLAMHGQEFPTAEPGPLDHQQGRCDRLPVTKSWQELGFQGIDEPEDVFPDARGWFDGLSDADQLRILGPQRLEMLRSGTIGWDDLSIRRSTPGWRDSYGVPSARQLRDGYRAPARPTTVSAPAVPTLTPVAAPAPTPFDFTAEFDRINARELRQSMEQQANAVVQKHGLSAKASGTGTDNKARVHIDFTDVDGKVVGQMKREFYSGPKPVVSNELFFLDPVYQGKGIASELGANLEKWYRESGVTRITLNANIDVGGYAWAKKGFGWDMDKTKVRDMQNLGNRFRNLESAEYAKKLSYLSAKRPEEWPTPYELAMVGWTPGAEDWVGRQVMLGSNWYGEKKL